MENLRLSAIWDITFTVDAVIARPALARVAVHVVGAGASIPAGIAGALVYLLLTALAIETSSALAQEPPHFVNARTTITAWTWKRERKINEIHVDWCFQLGILTENMKDFRKCIFRAVKVNLLN